MATPNLTGTKTIRDKAVDYLADKVASEQLHKDLVNLTHQFQLTQSVLKNNNKQLQEQAKTDTNVANMLKASESSILQEVSDKILNREEVSNDEAAGFVDTMEQIVSTLDGLSGDFKLSASDLAHSVKNFVVDERTSNDERNKFLDTFMKQSENEEINNQLLALRGEEVDQNLDKIAEVLETFSADKQANDLAFESMKDLNNSIDDLVVTQEEFNEKAEKGGVLSKFKEKAGSVARGAKTKVGLALDAISAITALAVILLPIMLPMVMKFFKNFSITKLLNKRDPSNITKEDWGKFEGAYDKRKRPKTTRKTLADFQKKKLTEYEIKDKEQKRQDVEFEEYIKRENNTPTVINNNNNITNMASPSSNQGGGISAVAKPMITGLNVRFVRDPDVSN